VARGHAERAVCLCLRLCLCLCPCLCLCLCVFCTLVCRRQEAICWSRNFTSVLCLLVLSLRQPHDNCWGAAALGY